MKRRRDPILSSLRNSARAELRRFNKRHPKVSRGVRVLMANILAQSTDPNMTYEQAYRSALASLERYRYRHRSSVTGRWVSRAYAKRHPRTTIRERVG